MRFCPTRNMQSPMKRPGRTFSRGAMKLFLTGLLLVIGTESASGQDQCEAIYHNVQVDMWALPTPNGMVSEKDDIRRKVVSITNAVLDAINARQQPQHPDISTEIMSQMARDFNSDFCVRKGRAPRRAPFRYGPYNLLLIPDLDRQDGYQVRGLHLVSDESGTTDMPQAILDFTIIGTNVSLEAVSLETESMRNARLLNQMGSDSKAQAAFDMVLQLERAYNQDGIDNIIGAMEEVLDDSKVGGVEVIVSQFGSPDKNKNAAQYISDLRRNIEIYGETEITYEVIDVYQLNNTDIYRVTLVQHWMYENPNSYVDSDYLAIDVVFNGDQPAISRRQAGRGAFYVYSRPSNVQITQFNEHDWSAADPSRTTPFEHLINAPLQYHTVRLENVWYVPIDTFRTVDDVFNQRNIMVDMQHRDAQIVLNIVPGSDGAMYSINGMPAQPVENGTVITIPWTELGGVPSPDGAITSDERTINVAVSHPDLDPETFFDETIVLTEPEPLTVNVAYPAGTLVVTSNPEPSRVYVNGEPVGMTPMELEMNATPDTEPLLVQVRNDTCAEGRPVNECLLHIPSELREVHIEPQQTSDEDFILSRFLVRDLTDAGDITLESIDRDGDDLTVRYNVKDNRDKNRKFIVDFDLYEGSGVSKVVDLEDQAVCSASSEASADACVGKGLTPNTYAFTWNMADAQRSLEGGDFPVLTLRRKSTCWPCVLLPAAAGVAAAYIWPRTGSGGDDNTFIPPPRP